MDILENFCKNDSYTTGIEVYICSMNFKRLIKLVFWLKIETMKVRLDLLSRKNTL